MTAFTTLQSIAYQREAVLARRLARDQAMPFEQALRAILQQAAGEGTLADLVALRLAARQATADKRAAQRQARADALLQRQLQALPEPWAWQAWFDGSTHPNPGKMGLGGVLQSPAGERIQICRAAGQGDSNEAEYLALIAVLQAALPMRPQRLIVYGDSRVVIDGLAQAAKAPAADRMDASEASGAADDAGAGRRRAGPALAHYRRQALQLIAQLASVELRWIPRQRNGYADALSQQAVGREV